MYFFLKGVWESAISHDLHNNKAFTFKVSRLPLKLVDGTIQCWN